MNASRRRDPMKALATAPKLAKANLFYARVLREEGKYDEAAGQNKTGRVTIDFSQIFTGCGG
jgi:hypothetical protein